MAKGVNGELMIVSGSAHPALAKEICRHLKVPPVDASVGRFSDGEIQVKINQDVRGRDVFVVQPTCPPVDEHLMELLILIDALRRASARRITATVPYYGYARQDRKDQPRVPITARLVANLITTAGANRVLTMDLHAGQIQGFFDIPLDHLFAINVFDQYLHQMKLRDLVVVSPDVGGVKMARAYAKRFHAALAVVDKRRVNDRQTEVMHIMGEVRGKHIIIVDDLIATGSSIIEAVQALKQHGAKDIYACTTHPVLSGPAIQRLRAASGLKQLIVTNTIPIPKEKQLAKIKVLSVAPLLAEAIRRIHEERSISTLFGFDIKV